MALVLRFAPGLAFALEHPSAPLLALVERHFRPQVSGEPTPADAIRLEDAAPPEDGATALALRDGPLVIRRGPGVLRLESEGAVAWFAPGRGRAGLTVHHPSPTLETFVGRGLVSFLLELALERGFLGLHAAAVAPGGRAVLLPGASGAGKTTTFRSCHAAGFPVLSDDLVLLSSGPDGPVVWAFERGVPSEPVPAPTLPSAPLAAIVAPSIAAVGPSRLEPLPCGEAVAALLAESPFLAAGPTAGVRFQALARVASAVPSYRLLAGPRLAEVPPLLAALG